MLFSLHNFNYETMNIPDVMHNLQRFFIYLLDTLVGPNSEGWVSKGVEADKEARRMCKKHGLRPELWLDREIHLEKHYADVLRGCDPNEILSASRKWCVKWWKQCGKKIGKGTRIAELRQQVITWHEMLSRGENIVVSVG